MQGARRRPWWLPRASRATPQTPLSLPTLRDRADFPSSIVVASLLGPGPTASAPPRLRGNLPRSRPREILRQAPRLKKVRAAPRTAPLAATLRELLLGVFLRRFLLGFRLCGLRLLRSIGPGRCRRRRCRRRTLRRHRGHRGGLGLFRTRAV